MPGYVVAVRQLGRAEDVSWRIPAAMLSGARGMAVWLARAMYDYFGFYAPAFAVWIRVDLLNVAAIYPLVLRERAQPSAVR